MTKAAERQARYRARKAAEAVDLSAILAAIQGLTQEVRALAQASRDASADSADSRGRIVDTRSRRGGQASRDASADSADSGRNVTVRRARARTRETEAPAPYGGLGASRSDEREDAWRVLQVMDGKAAHVGSIRDILGWDTARIVAALVHAQAQGQVRRVDGATLHHPTTWQPCPDPIREEAALVLPAIAVDPAPTLHVEGCQDYQAHQRAHQWDPALGAFRCTLCRPSIPAVLGVTPGLQDGQPSGPPAHVTH